MRTRNDKNTGRPKVKGPLRNFRFRKNIDDFLTSEAGEDKETGRRGRTGKDMTFYLEQALTYFMKLKPSTRDAQMAESVVE
jgi:hypothetical protein